MVKIEIDGKEVSVSPGSMIIEATDQQQIPVPRFCYHKKLSIAANCRMCLVDVEKAPKPLPACATPITEGMKIWTKSPKAIAAQKAVMEFLLINHPLDCPICDQGGECELQDISLEYGSDASRFGENKRVVIDKDLGPLISTDMTRCILCTRCIRFGEEITGMRELGAIGRGVFTEVSTFVTQNVNSECSGNVIDLCPVGALTNKPFRFKARSWELREFPCIGPHDCLG
jgi:NADH-quinone oxidoreductase subunit G